MSAARRVGISGAPGRMGRMATAAIAATDDLDAAVLYAPGHGGEIVEGRQVTDDPAAMADVDVVLELTRPDVVFDNLERWRAFARPTVVGTSGFDAERIDRLRSLWEGADVPVLVVPNFALGAVLMMRFAEEAARYLPTAEIVERHHPGKVDAPSGTAIATAERIARAGGRAGAPGGDASRGRSVAGIPVHALRLPGSVAHQEVLLGGTGETLRIVHDTVDRTAFMPGILLALRSIDRLPAGVHVGLEAVLGLDQAGRTSSDSTNP